MIFLMRHGEDDNTRLGGWSNAGLSLLGIEQSKHASEKILHGNYNIQYIFSSDLLRAKETSDFISKKLGIAVTFLREFREINNGDLAGISIERFQKFYPRLYYSSLDWEERYPNGESPKQFYNRIRDSWESFKIKVYPSNGNVLLVTHGGVIDVILCIENGISYTNKHTSHKAAYTDMISL